jgi:hypothetical protein
MVKQKKVSIELQTKNGEYIKLSMKRRYNMEREIMVEIDPQINIIIEQQMSDIT